MPDSLKRYRQMRDFSATPEPSGEPKKTRGRLPIFVIQKHQASHLHYDFRLEMEGVLKSWAVPKGPSYDPSVRRLAMMTEDHPYDYASFEGVIPEGNYGAGNVIIWDQGGWEFLEPGDDPVAALKEGKLAFNLYGRKMFGEWALVRIKGRSPKGNEWLLLKHRDAYANAGVDVTEVAPRSVVSNRLVEEMTPERTWQSNRPASRRRVTTLGAKLRSAAGEGEKARRREGEKAKTQSPTRRSKATRSAAGEGEKARRREGEKAKTQSPTRRSKATRSASAPSRGASARSRSSRAGSPPKARPTGRRRPR